MRWVGKESVGVFALKFGVCDDLKILVVEVVGGMVVMDEVGVLSPCS